MKLFRVCCFAAVFGMAGSAHAVLIDFTGGTVYQFGGGTKTTDGTANHGNVDYYEENGIRFDFIGPSGNSFSYNVGDYYSVGNDVIHGHWADGSFGDMISIVATKIDGSAFDLNYFKITTNTDCGGCSASGDEEVYLNALSDGVNASYSMLLPSDDWGFLGSNSEIFLGSDFDNILAFSVTYGSGAVGFGMDEFFIDEEAPGIISVPEPASIALLGLGLVGISLNRRKKNLKTIMH